MAFDKKLLELVACPVCKGKVVYDEKSQQLVCLADRLGYPIRDGIPVMIEDSATQLSADVVESLR